MTDSPPATGVGPLAISVALFLMIFIGSLCLMSVRSTSAQEKVEPAVVQRDIATIRMWMQRAIEFKDWSRLTSLAKRMAGEGEYEEAMEWLTKIPVGDKANGMCRAD